MQPAGATLPASARASCPPSSAKWWGAGTGCTRTEALHGLPTTGVELALAGGRRHFPGASPGAAGRTKPEALSGLPLEGRGADISMAGGRQHVAPMSPTGRTKIDLLHGLPMVGRDADISLAGGRRHFPGAASRSGSAPPCAGSGAPRQCDTLRDLQCFESEAAVGRDGGKREKREQLRAAQRRVSWCPQTSAAARARSDDGGVAAGHVAGTASPRAGGASPRAGGGRRFSGATKPGSPKGLASRRRPGTDAAPDQGQPEGVTSPSSRRSGMSSSSAQERSAASLASRGSKTSLASLTSELSQCLNLSSCVKNMARNISSANPTNQQSMCPAVDTAMDAMVRDKMDVAWAAVCQKLDIPFEGKASGKAGPGSPKKAAGGRKCSGAGQRPALPRFTTAETSGRQAMPVAASARDVAAPGDSQVQGKPAVQCEAAGAAAEAAATPQPPGVGGPPSPQTECMQTPRAFRPREVNHSDNPESPSTVLRFSRNCSFVLLDAKEAPSPVMRFSSNQSFVLREAKEADAAVQPALPAGGTGPDADASTEASWTQGGFSPSSPCSSPLTTTSISSVASPFGLQQEARSPLRQTTKTYRLVPTQAAWAP